MILAPHKRIISLRRNGITDVTPSGEYAYGVADEVTATISGNRPTALRVRSEAEEFSRRTGFGRDIDATLTYDECGRLQSDESRGIASIEYDNNGYPRRTVFTSGAVHTDLYDGLGNHISTSYERGGVAAGSRRYTGDGHVIRCGESDTLEMARFPGGFFKDLWKVYYYIPDYRGSVAAVTNSSGGVEHYYNYYPYGELWIEPDETQHRFDILSKAVNRYTFGDKERLTADGIHEYDQSARRYAPSYPFFTTPDAMASKTPWLSPYAFCAANPVNAIDPTGNDTISVKKENGVWGIVDTKKAEGNDVINVTNENGTGASHIYDEGEYGNRVVALNLETTDDYNIGVMHVSGEGREGTFLYVTPGGESSNELNSHKRIDDGVYPVTTPGGTEEWRKPGVGGSVVSRGVRFHYGNNLIKSTEGCFVLCDAYLFKNGGIYADPDGNSKLASRRFDNILGAYEHYSYPFKKTHREGAKFRKPIEKTLYLRSY